MILGYALRRSTGGCFHGGRQALTTLQQTMARRSQKQTFRSVVATIGAIAAVAAGMPHAAAADFPSKAIRFVAPDAGGSADTTARVIGQGLLQRLGQPVVVENRGGSGVIAGQIVATSQPDGYTLLFFGSTIWMLPMLHDKVPFDPVKDFVPVTLATRTPLMVVVNPTLPAKSIRELMDIAKARPGELNYGSAGIGGANHLAPELFKSMAKVEIMHIAYKGVGPALNDLISGRLQVMFPAVVSGMPHVKSGRLRALAVTTAEPTALAPGLPTVAASGLPGYEASYLLMVLAPAKTPPAAVKILSEAMAHTLNAPETKDKLFAIGIEAVGSTPQVLAATAKVEVAKWGKLIKEAGIHN